MQGKIRGYLLVEEDFAVLSARSYHFLEAGDTVLVGFGALEEAAVATDCIAHAILCCAVEF
jgi:hypothetical protein